MTALEKAYVDMCARTNTVGMTEAEIEALHKPYRDAIEAEHRRTLGKGISLLPMPRGSMASSLGEICSAAHRQPTELTIHEHRAPTDESIRLAKEFKEKIRSQLLEHGRFSNNTFSCDWSVFQSDLGLRVEGHCLFKLNGVGKHLKFDLSRYEWLEKSRTDEDVALFFRDLILKHLAGILTLDLFKPGFIRMIGDGR